MTMTDTPPKKGLPWFAWVGIGCGVLVLLAVIAVAGLGMFAVKKGKDLAQDIEDRPVYMLAATIARFNPEIELVSADEDTKTVVLRNVDTGEEMTFDLEEIQSGNFSFEKGGERVDVRTSADGVTVDSGDGTARFGTGKAADLPSWVPVPERVAVRVGYSSKTTAESSGVAELAGFSSAESVLDFYRKTLGDRGFEITEQTFGNGAAGVVSVTGQKSDPRRMISVVKTTGQGAQGKEVKVTLNYNGAN